MSSRSHCCRSVGYSPRQRDSTSRLDHHSREGLGHSQRQSSTDYVQLYLFRHCRTTLTQFMTNQDVPGLWNHLATYSPATNDLFVVGVLKRFYNDRYKPPNDTIDAFATRLLKAQETIAGTDRAISDTNLCINYCLACRTRCSGKQQMESF